MNLGMLRFESPLMALLALIPLVLWLVRRRMRLRKAAVGFSSVRNVSRLKRSLRQRLLWVPMALRWTGCALLIIALMRPQAGHEQVQEISQGVAIEMVLDRSGSMQLEMDFEGKLRNRLDCAKEVFRRFVFGHGSSLKGRGNDLIGMVAFARYADTVCPLTLTHNVIKPFLDTVKLADTQAEDGTAIGDAVALAAARLHTVEETLAKQNNKETKAYKIKSKVMILLTDGENNCGRRNVLQGGEIAKKWGIRLYVIALTSDDVYQTVKTPFGNVSRRVMAQRIDTRELEKIAEDTGGFFRSAGDTRALQRVYEEIDSMERSEVESTRFVDYKELFAPFVLWGFAILALEQLLCCTYFRRLP